MSGALIYTVFQCLIFIVVKFAAVCNGCGTYRVTLKSTSDSFIAYATNALCFSNT